MNNPRDSKFIMSLMVIVFFYCLMDSTADFVDGMSGGFCMFWNYFGNTYLFFANMTMAYVWVHFIASHLNYPLSKIHRMIMKIVFAVGCVILVVNFFVPFVFSISDANLYSRGVLYWLYLAIAFCFMLDSLVIYFVARSKGGVLRFFPVWIFMVPVVVGVFIQTIFYGTSFIATGLVIGLSGVIASLKNEMIFRDRLTGLYNRAYFEFLREDVSRSKNENKNTRITGIMIDINFFKGINDKYGHAVGDLALCDVATLLRASVEDYGVVIRYAGDEFVVWLNTHENEKVEKMIEKINTDVDNFNKTKERPYTLSLAMGYAPFDLKTQSFNDFMNTIDNKMYQNKAEFYNKLKEQETNDKR